MVDSADLMLPVEDWYTHFGCAHNLHTLETVGILALETALEALENTLAADQVTLFPRLRELVVCSAKMETNVRRCIFVLEHRLDTGKGILKLQDCGSWGEISDNVVVGKHPCLTVLCDGIVVVQEKAVTHMQTASIT